LPGLVIPDTPEVFDDYFGDSIKEVDISQDSAIKACIQNGDAFADKVKSAYGDCFGKDYDFDDLAKTSKGKDSDNDGLPDDFENNEVCFYTKMGWADSSSMKQDVIKNDLNGFVDANIKKEFDDNVDACAAWSGDFSARRKREVTGEEESAVPAFIDTQENHFGVLQALVRNRRSETNGGKKKGAKRSGKNGNKGGKRSGKSTKKGGKRSGKKGKNDGKESGKNGKNGTKRSGKNGAKDDKKKEKKSEKNEGKDKKKEQKRTGKKEENKKIMDESTYNKLWCADIAMEQALEKCVENKIKS